MGLPSVADIEARARKELGYVERGGGDGQSGNIVKYWPDNGWAAFQGQSWCAAFITWLFLPWPDMAWLRYLECNAGERLFKARKRFYTDPREIRKGDVVFYHFKLPGADHTGFAVADADPRTNTVLTIEGNTRDDAGAGQTNGGGVYQKRREFSLIHGYGRPDYSPTSVAQPPAFYVQGAKGFVGDPDGTGGWVHAADGGVFTVGAAHFLGSKGGQLITAPFVGMAATPSGKGYWLASADGGVFPFGDALFLGSMAGQPLFQPIAAMDATPSGKGYWLVASDGGVFAYGDAPYLGGMGGRMLTQPIMAVRSTSSGRGYWLLGRDGGVFAYGDAPFFGSMAGRSMNAPPTAIVPTAKDAGYVLVGADGGMFNFGDAAWQPYPRLIVEYQRKDRMIVGAARRGAKVELVSDHLETYVL